MTSEAVKPVSKKLVWTGRVLTGLVGLLLLFSGTMKVLAPPDVVKGFGDLGLPVNLALPIGILEIGCAVVFLIPQTAVIGAILVTGYMGGAILTHLRVGDAVWAQVLVGVVAWLGVYLREPRLWKLIPLRR